jgi:penicillin amidase
MVIGDSAGHIAWTIIGQIPRRFGMDGRDATSWADGTRGWSGYLGASEVPTIVDPPAARLWTANARTLGGAELAKLGIGGNYDDGARALRIRQRLFARDRFAERDMLAIQTDSTALRIRFWQGQMLAALDKAKADPRLAAMIAPVKAWDGRAGPASVGYRLIHDFRAAIIRNAYVGYVGKPDDAGSASFASSAAEQAMRTLLRARPLALVPPGYANWDAVLATALGDVATSVDKAGGGIGHYTWGGWLTASIHHPLAQALPLLGRLTDPVDQPMPGDNGVVRAQGRGKGASERIVVSPGHEAEGLFHMPGGQSGAPLAPYYLAGHTDWVEGRATPLLPGATRWTLTLVR